MLGVKQDEILTLKNRYLTGLEKLEFASSQVGIMQAELKALQPELIQTSAETEKLMVKIEQDTVEVEAKKEVRFQLDQKFSATNLAYQDGQTTGG
jgi:dynein heavy chain